MAIVRIAEHDQNEVRHTENIARAVNGLIAGKADVTETFTLTANSATTTVTDTKFESNMVVIWAPTTANAASAMTNLYISSRSRNSFTLTHANNAQTDRTFLYIRMG
jgi:hypothetical protein